MLLHTHKDQRIRVRHTQRDRRIIIDTSVDDLVANEELEEVSESATAIEDERDRLGDHVVNVGGAQDLAKCQDHSIATTTEQLSSCA